MVEVGGPGPKDSGPESVECTPSAFSPSRKLGVQAPCEGRLRSWKSTLSPWAGVVWTHSHAPGTAGM